MSNLTTSEGGQPPGSGPYQPAGSTDTFYRRVDSRVDATFCDLDDLVARGRVTPEQDRELRQHLAAVQTFASQLDRAEREAQVSIAVDEARRAFWRTLAAHFPSAVTGDLAPDLEAEFVNATALAARAWLTDNAPDVAWAVWPTDKEPPLPPAFLRRRTDPPTDVVDVVTPLRRA